MSSYELSTLIHVSSNKHHHMANEFFSNNNCCFHQNVCACSPNKCITDWLIGIKKWVVTCIEKYLIIIICFDFVIYSYLVWIYIQFYFLSICLIVFWFISWTPLQYKINEGNETGKPMQKQIKEMIQNKLLKRYVRRFIECILLEYRCCVLCMQ